MKKIIVTILFCFLGCISCIWAEEAKEVALEDIVITPRRKYEKISQSPSNISIINRAEIEASKARTIPELLETQGALILRDYIGNGKATNADIRGFGEAGMSNVLVLVDGRRVNNIDLSGTDWIQIPVAMVEKIEIIKGAASVLYGDNASGGVVNIITKGPSKKNEGKAEVMGGSYGTYGERAEFSLNKGKFSALGLFDQYRTDGYRVNSDLLRNDIHGKFVYSATDALKAKISFGNHKDKYGLPGGLRDIQLNTRDRRSSVNPDDYTNSRDYFIDFGIENNFQEFGKIEVNLSRRKRDTFTNLVASSWMTERDTITYTANPKYTLESDVFHRKNKFIAGIDYFDAEQDIVDGGYAGDPDKLTLSKKSYGLYLLDQFYIIDEISFSGGYRHETAHYNFEQERVLQGSEQSKFKEDVFNTALNYNYLPDSNIYLSFSDSFRHPLVDEVYTSKFDFGFGPGGGLNTALSPQTAKNFEAGIRHRFNKNLGIGLSGYIMKLHNEIYFEPTTFLNTNYDNTTHRGAEFSADMTVSERIKLFARYTFTDAFFEGGMYNKKKIPAVAEHTWTAGGDIALNKHLTFSLFGNYIGERYFISDQPNVLPRMASYFVVDAKLSLDRDNYSLFLAVNNLFDEEYYEYGAANGTRTIKNYYPAAERNFILGGSVKF